MAGNRIRSRRGFQPNRRQGRHSRDHRVQQNRHTTQGGRQYRTGHRGNFQSTQFLQHIPSVIRIRLISRDGSPHDVDFPPPGVRPDPGSRPGGLARQHVQKAYRPGGRRGRVANSHFAKHHQILTSFEGLLGGRPPHVQRPVQFLVCHCGSVHKIARPQSDLAHDDPRMSDYPPNTDVYHPEIHPASPGKGAGHRTTHCDVDRHFFRHFWSIGGHFFGNHSMNGRKNNRNGACNARYDAPRDPRKLNEKGFEAAETGRRLGQIIELGLRSAHGQRVQWPRRR